MWRDAFAPAKLPNWQRELHMRPSCRYSSPLSVLLLCVLARLSSPALGDVVISEIHYNPSAAGAEYLELTNTGVRAVDLTGWRFVRGIRFEFPSILLPAGGRLLVCQDVNAVAALFSLDSAFLLGNYAGSLSNGGETLLLEDAASNPLERLAYDDDVPWDPSADGSGASLQRVCLTFAADNPLNWSAAPPAPLVPSALSECPPPIAPPTVSFSEINYHPFLDRDLTDEFVELTNVTAAAVNLRGYSFSDGIEFEFTEDLILEPGGRVVVCRDVDHMRLRFGVENSVGNFAGTLSNDGERLTLVRPDGAIVDTIAYRDEGDWPVAADGIGRSLEKIDLNAVSDSPAAWLDAGIGDLSVWRSAQAVGIARARTNVVFYIRGEGEFLIDNVRLVDSRDPETNLLANSDFAVGSDGWEFGGNHAETFWDSTAGADGGGALRVIATDTGNGSSNTVRTRSTVELETRGPLYVLQFDYRYVGGDKRLVARQPSAIASSGIFFELGEGVLMTAGGPNSVALDGLPPLVNEIERFPRQPRSTDVVWVTARVTSASPLEVLDIIFNVNDAEEHTTLPMRDDGAHGDGAAGDGIFGVELPPQPHDSAVAFRIVAVDVDGRSRISPLESDPSLRHGYYVNDVQLGPGGLEIYTLLRRGPRVTPRSAISGLSCETYRPVAFAYRGDLYYNVELRQRGQSVCNSRKPYLKVRFRRGRDFQKQHKINLQSLWTDKSLVRENMAWETFQELGFPACKEKHVRLHANGAYVGLYADLEHPDSRFLDRNRLNPTGNLYKAVASVEQRHASYSGPYEKKTNENGDFSDLAEFIDSMHLTASEDLLAFFQARVDEDRMIDYVVGQAFINNGDFPHKNHYLYHDPDTDRWMPLVWDIDLSFGKNWSAEFGGVLHDGMSTPGLNPWFLNGGGPGTGNQLLDKFFGEAGDFYRRALAVRLWDVLQEKYRQEVFDDKTSCFIDLLVLEQERDIDEWGRSAPAGDLSAPAEFLPNIDRVLEHTAGRRPFLIDRVNEWLPVAGHDRLKITEVMFNPPGSDDVTEFLEMWNPDDREIDISGWHVEGLGYTFPDGTRVSGGEIFVLAKDPDAFRAAYSGVQRVLGPYSGGLDNDGEILRLKDGGPGYPATIDFLRYGDRDAWPHLADGFGHSLELTDIHATRDNDVPHHWQASTSLGGSPGAMTAPIVEPIVFRRGDANGDLILSVSDPITILLFLYRGEADRVSCELAADVNADDEVAMGDAIHLLQYLFTRPDLTIPSPGPGECLPAPPDRCGESNCWVRRF